MIPADEILAERHREIRCTYDFVAHAALTMEVAVGFRNWCNTEAGDIAAEEFYKENHRTADTSELLTLYLNEIKK
jgi:hypothetical protein